MKTVMTNSQVKHVWAQQTQAEGRSNNGQCYFRGPTLYSYDTPIAHFVTVKVKDGKKFTERRACLITTISYSVTTSGKHMPRSYDISGAKVFYVPYIGIDGGRAPHAGTLKAMHKLNVAEFVERYSTNLKLATTAKAAHRIEGYLNALNTIRKDASDYCEFFAYRVNIEKLFPAASPELLAEIKARVIKNAKAEKEQRAKKNEALRKQYAEHYAEFLRGECLSLNYHAEEAATPEMKRQIAAQKLKLWREGRIHSLPMKEGTYLRVRHEDHEGGEIPQPPATIETSRGALFPVTHALKALPIIRRVKATGEAWHTNGHTIHLGPFQIDAIEPDGTVIAGCHTVAYDEIELIAKELNQ